ncbi:mitochondrial import inner membrane translocase subunit tim54 [Vermiconidia calcicola]|uniref:Mitochondrial import inner membrane translocase subunit tim54 n=1 Tax=Vermiconidia calcicola TaxID=1690605 RepID=A0ACC3NXZ2_9PEZI|nr:mitochondrial import inner membrane translocase subunit tim54 [Vermiconidia calcicola]
MSEKAGTSAAENAAGASSAPSASSATNRGSSAAAPKGAANQGNPAFRMMGLPRLRLPSRNWSIFFTITGSFAGAVIYDKWQTRRIREKWANLVSHIADETLPTHTMPRKLTVYLAAPPGDGLRVAREHFHNYIKPVLVAAAIDWDVVEGRKEGDVRFKTADRIRKKRRRNGEGEQLPQEEADKALTVEALREKSGTVDWDGVAGDLIVGRNTWKEYVRGLHEGWLGPVDAPKPPVVEQQSEFQTTVHSPGHASLGDVAVKAAANTVAPSETDSSSTGDPKDDASPASDDASPDDKSKEDQKENEEEKPKPRHPPPHIQPSEYSSATPSHHIPELVGPSIGVRFPHILGFRNTPIRIYRFLTRRHLADSVGRDVAAAVLASHRPFPSDSTSYPGDDSNAAGRPEQSEVLLHEEKDWWKTTFQPRKVHEESVWIEDMVLDERIANRMRVFQLTAEDEDRAKRISDGREKAVTKDDLES